MEVQDGWVEVGRGWVNVELQGPGVSGFSLAFIFLRKPEATCFNRREHARRSDRRLPRENSSPYSIRRVDGVFRKFITSATDSRGEAKVGWAGCGGCGCALVAEALRRPWRFIEQVEVVVALGGPTL
jgi:hypothetical protein